MSKSSSIILPTIDISLNFSDKINKLTKPLLKFDITYFCYFRIYPDGSALDICNSPSMQEYFYYKSDWYKIFNSYTLTTDFNSNFILDKCFIDSGWINEQKKLFDVDYVIYYIRKNAAYNEYWQFGTKTDNHAILTFYIQHAELLKSFANYFLREACRLIQLADKNRYILSINNEDNKIDQTVLYEIDRKSINQINCLFQGEEAHKFNLTPKEIECIKLSANGASSKEIGIKLNISYRTVEKHIENIKQKTGLKKLIQIITEAKDLGLI